MLLKIIYCTILYRISNGLALVFIMIMISADLDIIYAIFVLFAKGYFGFVAFSHGHVTHSYYERVKSRSPRSDHLPADS